MSFVAREEIDSVPDCAAHLKVNGEFVLIFLKKCFFKYYRRQCNYCRKLCRLLVQNVSTIIKRSLPKRLCMLITQPKPKAFFQDIFQAWTAWMRYSTKTARNEGSSVLFRSKRCEYCTQCGFSYTLFLIIQFVQLCKKG